MLLLLVPVGAGDRRRAVRAVARRRADPRPAGGRRRSCRRARPIPRAGSCRWRPLDCGGDAAAQPLQLRHRRRGGPRRRGEGRLPADRAVRRRRRRRGRRRATPSCSPATPAPRAGRRYGFSDYARGTPIVVLAIAFAVVVGAGRPAARAGRRWSGWRFAFFILFRFVLPGLLAEESPTLVSLVGSSAIMFVVLYLAHGFSARTTTALVGTLFGLDAGGGPGVGRGVRRPG